MAYDWPAGAPAISIVTPTFNRRDVLLRAIASVQAQDYRDYEHIVVDDGSTDGTREAVLAIDDPRLRYLRLEERRGANAARNHGIRAARAEIVTFLDSDDHFLRSRLERTISRFSADPSVDLAISSFETIKGKRSSPTMNRGARIDGPTLERLLIAQVVSIAGSAITVRNTALDSVGGFDEGLGRMQDRDLLLRLAAAGYGAELLEDVDWVKHASADSISGRRDGYVAAYGALLTRHPHLRERYPDIVAYMVARRLLSNLVQGRLGILRAELRANSADPALAFSAASLVTGYLRGRTERKRIAGEAWRRPAATPAVAAPSEPATLST